MTKRIKCILIVATAFTLLLPQLLLPSIGTGVGRAWADPKRPIAQSISLGEAANGDTKIEIGLSTSVRARVFTLLNPHRVVVDVASLGFRFPNGSTKVSNRLVKAFRFGEVAPGRSRMVFDLTKAATPRHTVQTVADGAVLTVNLSTGAAIVRDHQSLGLRPSRFAPRPAPKARPGGRRRPIIVIDPGHGGADPGAVTKSGLKEKDIVLAVARRIRADLQAKQHVRVLQTRASDRFVSLDERAAIAERVKATLFLSLHADAVADPAVARKVRGATIYTLAERASDRYAQELAEKENASDVIAGLQPIRNGPPEVQSILFDLMRRESANQAAQFRERLISELAKTKRLSSSPRRSAAFRVLKQLETPAVLIELGYMSNARDQALMQTEEWQRSMSQAIVAAIHNHIDAE